MQSNTVNAGKSGASPWSMEWEAKFERERAYKERAWRIVDRVLPEIPATHGFYDPQGFVSASQRRDQRNRLFYRTFARLRAKAEGGAPFIAVPKNCEHLYGPGNAMFDVARELEKEAAQ